MAAQSRPEPMNASPHHAKVKVALTLSDQTYVAGGFVSGKMEVECRMDKGLGMGVIMVELFALEELVSRDHSATSTFMHSRRLFQGPGLPPSNAVEPYPIPGSPPLPTNYFHARKGLTTFLFRIPLPASSPSAISFGPGIATVRYEVRGSVGVAYKGENRLVTDKMEIDVVEIYEEDFGRRDPEGVIIGEKGKIWIQGRVVGGLIVAGRPACVELQVKNHSTKKNSGLSISLIRELRLPQASLAQKPPFHVSDTLTTVAFRGPEYVIQPGSEGVANLVFDTPQDARGVKGGLRVSDDDETNTLEPLFEVRCIISIKMTMGIGSKDIILDLPVTILHTLALPAFHTGPEPFSFQHPYSRPLSPSPVIYPDRSTSPYGYLPTSVFPLHMGQTWLPPNLHPYPYFSPSLPHQHYYHPSQPSAMLPLHIGPYTLPARPSSTEPVPSLPLHTLPSGLPVAPAPPPSLIPFPTMEEQVQHHVPHEPRVEPEEGKGERAYRISRHLRMSTRARSVSPSQHRFPLPVGTSFQQSSVDLAGLGSSLGESIPFADPSFRVGTTVFPSPPNKSTLFSPRPIRSPKVSFNSTTNTMSKCERVEVLERIAAENDKENGDISGAGGVVGSSDSSKEKTLPVPPLPSWKENETTPKGGIAASLTRQMNVAPTLKASSDPVVAISETFATLVNEETPPTPTLVAVIPLKLSRPRGELSGLGSKPASGGGGGGGFLSGGTSGLDALEARLVAEVGTRKVEKDNRKADVRSVLVAPIDIPTARGRRISGDVIGEGGNGGLGDRSAGHEINDSAISSLTLAGEMSMMSPRDADLGRTPRLSSSRGSSGSRSRRSRSRARTVGQGVEVPDLHHMQKTERQRQATEVKKNNSLVQKDEKDERNEGRKMRKAVRGRVTAWLGSIDPDVPPPQVPTPPPTSPFPTMSIPAIDYFDAPRSPSPTSPLRNPIPSSEKANIESPRMAEEDKDVSAAPNPRSSGFVPLASLASVSGDKPIDGRTTPKAISPSKSPSIVHSSSESPGFHHPIKFGNNLIVRYPNSADPGVKYDVRSARGGRGGKVTAVAAIWASAGQGGGMTAQVKNSKAGQKNLVSKKFDIGKIKAVPGTDSPSSSSTEGEDKLKSGGAGGAYKRARMVKSSSVPAIVSSSLAIPMLSSTASLMRPGDGLSSRERPLKISRTFGANPTSEEDRQPSSAGSGALADASRTAASGVAAKAELAFGQARLRQLIQKYQGGS